MDSSGKMLGYINNGRLEFKSRRDEIKVNIVGNLPDDIITVENDGDPVDRHTFTNPIKVNAKNFIRVNTFSYKISFNFSFVLDSFYKYIYQPKRKKRTKYYQPNSKTLDHKNGINQVVMNMVQQTSTIEYIMEYISHEWSNCVQSAPHIDFYVYFDGENVGHYNHQCGTEYLYETHATSSTNGGSKTFKFVAFMWDKDSGKYVNKTIGEYTQFFPQLGA